VVREFLEADGVKTDEMFPPYSPDLNLIENVWGLLSTRMAQYDVKTVPELIAAVKYEWAPIDENYIQRLYHTYRDRLIAVIAADGGNTDY
jgi:transposase